MTFKEILEEIPQLSELERKELLFVLIETITERKQASILDFAGVGAELYDGLDAQEYVNRLRSDWDERP